VGTASLTDSLNEALRPKHLLLVLDNFEHLPGAVLLVPDLLAAGPGLTVLVTSRAALGLSGEQEYPVPPLAVPPDVLSPAPAGPADLRRIQEAAAVRLFVARARAVSPSFALSSETAPAVAELCRRLDGLPLAIELAAARVRLFSPPALLARIEAAAGALPLLEGGPSDAPSRHRTLRNAIAWSYDLLSPREQALLRRLAVFSGGFGLGAAEAVDGGAVEGGGGGVVEALEGLVTKSLLRRDEREGPPVREGTGWLPPGWAVPAEAPPAPRFLMLETVREFAAQLLEESGEADAVRERHASCYTPLAARTQTYDARWLNDVEREHDNLRAAMRWCLARGGPSFARQGLRFGAALAHYWVFRGHLRQGQEELAWALSRPTPAGAGGAYHWARATLLTKAGHLARRRGDFSTARHLYEAGLALRRETGQRAMVPFSLRSLGALAHDQGDFLTARACHGEALVLRREAGSTHLCETLVDVGRLAQEDGDRDRARRLLQEGLDLARANALPHAIAAGHD
jgi:predicted ATPase